MIDVIIYPLAFFITLPILATWLIYRMSYRIIGSKKRAMILSINWTTVLYMIAVVVMLMINFEKHFIGLILGVMLIGLSIIIIFQWKTKTEVIFSRAVKILWRICFLCFSFAYICLVFFSITNRILFY